MYSQRVNRIARRAFLRCGAALGMAASAEPRPQDAAQTDRQYWVGIAKKLAEPVLSNIAAGTLKRNMPVESRADSAERRRYTHLEALGRLLAGIAPWLEAQIEDGAERDTQQRLAALTREAIRSATNPRSPDFLIFTRAANPWWIAVFSRRPFSALPPRSWRNSSRPPGAISPPR